MNRQQAALVRATKIISVVLAAMLFCIGLVLVIWSDNTEGFLRYMIGAQAILLGGGKILGYFSNDLYRIAYQFDFATGSAAAIYGVLLLTVPDRVLPYLPVAVAVYVLVDGLFRVQTSLDACRFGMAHWYLLLIAGCLLTLGGLWVLLFGNAAHRYVLMGICMIADAAVTTFVTMYTVRVRRRRQGRERALFRMEDSDRD